MGRPPKAYELRAPKPGRRFWTVRFHDPRPGADPKRPELGTHCEREPDAARAAPGIVAAYLAGHGPPKRAGGNRGPVDSRPLGEVAAQWLTATVNLYSPRSQRWFADTFTGLFEPCFRTMTGITESAWKAYQADRLGRVMRITVKKERAIMSSFLQWCSEAFPGYQPPALVPPPKRAQGTPSPRMKRSGKTRATDAEIRRILDLLPERSSNRGLRRKADTHSRNFPIRARFVVQYEQGLRSEFLDTVRFPEHFKPGDRRLVIEQNADKGRKARGMLLTERARLALESVCPPSPGLIFGRHDYRKPLKRAAIKVLGRERGETFTRRDIRRNRATNLLGAGEPLKAVQELFGHAKITTTAVYVLDAPETADALVTRQDATDRGAP